MFSVHFVYLIVKRFRDKLFLGRYINKDYHYYYYMGIYIPFV